MSRLNKSAMNMETSTFVEQLNSDDVQSADIDANADIATGPSSIPDANVFVGSLDSAETQVDENTPADELASSVGDHSASNSKAVADEDIQVGSKSSAGAQSNTEQRATKPLSKSEVRILKWPVIIEMQRNAARGMIVTPRGVVEIAKDDTVTTTDRAVVVFAAGYKSNGKGKIKIYVEPKDPEDLQDFYNQMSLAVMCAKSGNPVPLFPWSKAKVVY